ncbi:unnamed protein product [Strongylus vulgaris]|uniref:Reverse transcriptase domain-containing protein n=1 Tax=Strongylus vulgaris TaxID=40348 RepID=A0A3P7JAF1_STRVU|nr:unnamed protein product [Strongylus vulgaris]
MSHTLKIFERVLERRLRAIIELPSNQCGFVKGVIWWALRKHMVPEVYIPWIKMIYHGATSQVRTAAGQFKPFRIDRRASVIGAFSSTLHHSNGCNDGRSQATASLDSPVCRRYGVDGRKQKKI